MSLAREIRPNSRCLVACLRARMKLASMDEEMKMFGQCQIQ